MVDEINQSVFNAEGLYQWYAKTGVETNLTLLNGAAACKAILKM
jgi:hypothetical protein